MIRSLLALTIAMGAASASELTPAMPTPLSAERVLPSMQKAFGDVAANIEIIDVSHFPAPEGEVEFSLKDLNPPSSSNAPTRWRGWIRESETKTFAIWALVRISADCKRVVAVQNLEVGQPIQATQVREEVYQGFPFGKNSMVTLDDVVGRAPLRTLRTNIAVRLDAIVEPVVVAGGADIIAEFRSGRIRVTAPVVSLGYGRLGDTISVRNPASKKIFAARIQSPGHVIVEITQ